MSTFVTIRQTFLMDSESFETVYPSVVDRDVRIIVHLSPKLDTDVINCSW